MSVKVSVVVPVFNPGEHIDPLIESLQRQTMPQSDFETIFVDDGSTDETPEKLDRLAAAHDNVSVIHIPNSGWPGRPRNLGVEAAVGEYVQFVDHDDELGPEALERLYAYAQENGSDVVIGKEVRRSGKWHVGPIFDRNRPRATLEKDPILGILTPHKMFRREFLNKHQLRFFEGPRRMEDHPFVVESFFLADVVSVLADYPVYFWNRRPDKGNAGARPFDWADYYVYMRDVLDVVERHTRPGDFRDRLLSFWYDSKGLGILARNAPRKPREEVRRHFDALRELAEERFPPSVDAHLHGVMKVRSALLRANDFEGLLALGHLERGIHIEQSLTDLRTERGRLVLQVRTGLAYEDGSPVTFDLEDGRYRWRPPVDLGDAVPPEAFDFTRVYRRKRLELALRSRQTTEITLVKGTVLTPEPESGSVPFMFDVCFEVDPETVAHGQPLERSVYDVFLRVTCLPWRPHTQLRGEEQTAPRTPLTAVISTGRTLVPFTKPGGGIALDVDQKTLDLLDFGQPDLDAARLTRNDTAVVVRVPVDGLALEGDPVKGTARLERRDSAETVKAGFRLGADRESGAAFLRLRVPADPALAAGSWEVLVQLRQRRHRLPFTLEVGSDGTVALHGDDERPRRTLPGERGRGAALLDRGGRTVRRVARRVRGVGRSR
jgi:poly(ribitol-phosphate) beta-N-acetylglucosaminyltransferase